MKITTWPEAIEYCARAGRRYVIATVLNTQGSTPRDGGSKMVIDPEYTYDTIGGGQLEFLLVQQARELMARNETCQIIKPFPLAAEAAQCCGGNVTVMLECFAACDWQIALFGAGHVSQALTRILGGLPCQMQIIDSRPGLITDTLPANGRFCEYARPVEAIEALPDNAWVVIFTHDHALDYDLCCQLLSEDRWRFVGLIGSQTKANRFRKRLLNDGYTQSRVDRLHCPVGLPEVKGKHPMEVAVSIAAQLQSLYYQSAPEPSTRSSSWREIKQLLKGQKLIEGPKQSATATPGPNLTPTHHKSHT